MIKEMVIRIKIHENIYYMEQDIDEIAFIEIALKNVNMRERLRD